MKSLSIAIWLVFLTSSSHLAAQTEVLPVGDDSSVGAEALYAEALSYLNGEGVTKDPNSARSLLAEASEIGHAESQLALGAILMSDGYGLEPDYALAEKLFLGLEARGDKIASTAVYNLGIMYFFGSGVQQSDSIAAQYFSRAFDLGYPDADQAYRQANNSDIRNIASTKISKRFNQIKPLTIYYSLICSSCIEFFAEDFSYYYDRYKDSTLALEFVELPFGIIEEYSKRGFDGEHIVDENIVDLSS